MKTAHKLLLFTALVNVAVCAAPACIGAAQAQGTAAAKKPQPVEIQVPNGPMPARVLVQSPAETPVELQVICLFESLPENALHGSLAEANEKLKGLLDKIRKPGLFRGELGETILIEPPAGSIGAKRLLIVGLGDMQGFTPSRMELVGTIVYQQANRFGIAHPYFAPTLLDGGMSKYGTGETAEHFAAGFLRAARTQIALQSAGAAGEGKVRDLTFLAGPTHAADTRDGIARGFAQGGN